MPIYTARNKKTKKLKELGLMSFSEMEQWKIDNPNYEIVIGNPLIHSGIGLGLKSARTDNTFKDVIKEIDKKSPGNTLRDYTKI